MIKLFWNTHNLKKTITDDKNAKKKEAIEFKWGMYHKKHSDFWIYEILKKIKYDVIDSEKSLEKEDILIIVDSNPEKKIEIYSLQCTGQVSPTTFSFIADCLSGTYIRSLARDIARKLNTLGYSSYLRRTKLGKITEKDIILVDKFSELVHIGDHFELMHSIQDVLDDIQAVRLDKEFGQKFQNGLTFDYLDKKVFLKPIVIFSENNFLGIAEINKGNLKPVRVFNI